MNDKTLEKIGYIALFGFVAWFIFCVFVIPVAIKLADWLTAL